MRGTRIVPVRSIRLPTINDERSNDQRPLPLRSIRVGENIPPVKRIIGAILGIAAFAAVLAVDMPVGEAAQRLAAVAALVVVFWITEPLPIPVTALLGSVLCIGLGVAPAKQVLAPYGSPIIFLFIGAFLVGQAMVATGLDRRVAHSFLAVPALSRTPFRLVASVSVLAWVLSMWMSNTAATIVLMPLALSTLRGRKSGKIIGGSATVLAVAYAASVGGIATPIGTPPNLIAIGFLEQETGVVTGFGDWMQYALPLSAVLLVAVLALAWFGTRGAKLEGGSRVTSPEPWTRAEISVAGVFGAMVLLWLMPSLMGLLIPEQVSQMLKGRMPDAAVALSGAIALFVLPRRMKPYQPVMDWNLVGRIDWGTIFLFGGGLSMGHLVLSTGLGDWLGDAALSATGVETMLGLVVVTVAASTILSEFMSNTAASNMIIPVVIAMALKMGQDPLPAVMAAAFGASMAYMLPVSTPPNAIAYGTGEVTIPQMVRRGVAMDLLSFGAIVVWLVICFAL